MTALPIVNSAAVTTAPIHTSRQSILASGRILKIMANSSAITSK